MAWNRPTSNTGNATSSSRPDGRDKMPRLRRGLLAGAIVVLGAGLAAWLLTNGEADSRPLQKKERGLIKEVTPAAALTNAVPKKLVDPREDYDHSRMYRDEKGVLRWNSGVRAFDKSRPRNPIVMPGNATRRVFRYRAESEIASLLEAEPGEHRLATPDYYDERFLDSFKASLEHEIEIKEDDYPWDKDLKAAVIDAKKEIVDRMARGEKLGDILSAAQKDIDKLTAYKNDLGKQLDSIIKEGGGKYSDQDVRDVVTAANKMLEEKGINPIESDSFVRRNIRLRNGVKKTEKMKRAEAEAEAKGENK